MPGADRARADRGGRASGHPPRDESRLQPVPASEEPLRRNHASQNRDRYLAAPGKLHPASVSGDWLTVITTPWPRCPLTALTVVEEWRNPPRAVVQCNVTQIA